tara:strand:- start:2814 stop:3107 length:294 start_codon:yes stop_codon:yes gene_type:complete
MDTKTKKETEAKTAQPSATANATAPQQPAGTDLSIADLKNLATIIDVASTRGAFRANEMATVGAMYNKLSAFLVKVTPPQAPAGDLTSAAAPATAKK